MNARRPMPLWVRFALGLVMALAALVAYMAYVAPTADCEAKGGHMRYIGKAARCEVP